MIIYGDILFLENFIIGGVIIYITGLVSCSPRPRQSLRKNRLAESTPGTPPISFFRHTCRKLRFLTGCILCGGFSLIIAAPSGMLTRMPVNLVMEVAFALILCLTVFGRQKLWQRAVVLILVTYFMGGMTMGLLLVTGNQAVYSVGGIYTGDMKAGLLAVFIGMCLFTSRMVIKTVYSKKFYQEHYFKVKIRIEDFITETTAFLDTGNGLVEPISGKPVAVAHEELWEEMQRAGALVPERAHLVPYEAIGSKGLLQGIRADYIELEGRYVKGCIIAKADGINCFAKVGVKIEEVSKAGVSEIHGSAPIREKNDEERQGADDYRLLLPRQMAGSGG